MGGAQASIEIHVTHARRSVLQTDDVLLTYKTLKLAVPQRRCPHTISHQSKESLLHLPNRHPVTETMNIFCNCGLFYWQNKRMCCEHSTCSVVSKMTSLELVGMAS